MAYQVNEVVVYGSSGVFRVEDITVKKIGGQEMEYYVLKPIYEHGGSTIYVPIHNGRLAGKLRRPLSRRELLELLDTLQEDAPAWIENQNERRDKYREILSTAAPCSMVRAVRALYRHRREQEARGKRLYIADERFLKEAERLIEDEFAVSLEIEPKEVRPFIEHRLQTA